MTNDFNKVLYTGVTNNLLRRVKEHKNKINLKSFTSKYKVNKLIYFETFESSLEAITREKQIKGGSRKKKIDLIETLNPKYKDLTLDLFDSISYE